MKTRPSSSRALAIRSRRRIEHVAVAGQRHPVAAARLDQLAQLAGHLEDEVLLVRAVDGDGTGVDAAVAGVDHDHRQRRGPGRRPWPHRGSSPSGPAPGIGTAPASSGRGAGTGTCRAAIAFELDQVDHQPVVGAVAATAAG